MSIEIVKATAKDAEEIINYTKQIGVETDNMSYGSEGMPVGIEDEQQMLADMENSDKGIFLVAKKDGKIVGTANFVGFSRKRMAHRGEFGISVLKSEWGQGIGTQLLERIIDFAKNTAYTEILSLEVRSDNVRAIRLYEKYGFQKIGQFKGFFKINGEYVDFDLMNLELTK